MNSNVMEDDEDYYTIYGFGYVKSYHASLGIIQEAEIFVPRTDSLKVNIIRLKNTLSEKRRLKLVYYIKPVLGEDETKTSGSIDLEFDKEKNILFAKNIYGDNLSKNVYVSSSERITSYTGNDLSFAPNRDLRNPDGVYKVALSNENGLGTISCIAIQMEIDLDEYEDKKICLMLGEEDSKDEIYEKAKKYANVDLAYKELNNTRDYWNGILRKVQVKTKDEKLNFMLNRMEYVSNYCM